MWICPFPWFLLLLPWFRSPSERVYMTQELSTALPAPSSASLWPWSMWHWGDFEACHISDLKPFDGFSEFPVSFIILFLPILLALASLLPYLTLLLLPSSAQPIPLWELARENTFLCLLGLPSIPLLCEPPHGVVCSAIPQPLPVLTVTAGFHRSL